MIKKSLTSSWEFWGVLIVALVLLLLPALGVSDYTINLYGKYLCYAILAISVDMLWGYTGLLCLGQSLFFALGGYAFGMYLMMHIEKLGQYHSALPDFMVFLGYPQLPAHWIPFEHIGFAIAGVILVPGLLAFVFGYLAFRSRIRGVYFSILTQALTYAALLMFFRNDMTFGGNNGLTDFKFLLGSPAIEAADLRDPAAFGNQLKTGTDPVSKYLFTQLGDGAKAKAGTPDGTAPIVEGLNTTIATATIYDPARFAGVKLSEPTQTLIAQSTENGVFKSYDTGMLKLNRLLLEDAYPAAIAKKSFTGFVVNDPGTKRALYLCTVALLILTYLVCKWLSSTKFGKVQRAIRDSENRVLFSGYATANFKLFIFVFSAIVAGLAGALYVPQVGIINPGEMATTKSLEVVVWVAVGGRGTLVGPVIGAFLVNAMKSWATREFPDLWLIILGLSFVFVVLFMPKGIVGLFHQASAYWKSRKPESDPVSPPQEPKPTAAVTHQS